MVGLIGMVCENSSAKSGYFSIMDCTDAYELGGLEDFDVVKRRRLSGTVGACLRCISFEARPCIRMGGDGLRGLGVSSRWGGGLGLVGFAGDGCCCCCGSICAWFGDGSVTMCMDVTLSLVAGAPPSGTLTIMSSDIFFGRLRNNFLFFLSLFSVFLLFVLFFVAVASIVFFFL